MDRSSAGTFGWVPVSTFLDGKQPSSRYNGCSGCIVHLLSWFFFSSIADKLATVRPFHTG